MSNTQTTTQAAHAQKNSSQGNKKNTPMWFYAACGISALVILLLLYSSMKGNTHKKDEAVIQKKNESVETAVQGARPPSRSQQNQQTSTQNFSAQNIDSANPSAGQLKIYNDPTSGVEMVQTPQGPKPTASEEGQKYISDFNNLKQQTGGGTAQQPNSQQIQNAQMIQVLQTNTDAQVKALDDKINTAYETIDNLQEVVKKQNDTIEKLVGQLKTIQPIVKTPNQLAKELFGKNGDKILASRNNEIKVDSVVGDKAYFTDSHGRVSLLGVGDIVPSTSLKVKSIDPVNNKVIVSR